MTSSRCWEMSEDHPVTPSGRCDLYLSIKDKVLMSMRYPVDACKAGDLEQLKEFRNLVEVN
jgi:hypothetical protein